MRGEREHVEPPAIYIFNVNIEQSEREITFAQSAARRAPQIYVLILNLLKIRQFAVILHICKFIYTLIYPIYAMSL